MATKPFFHNTGTKVKQRHDKKVWHLFENRSAMKSLCGQMDVNNQHYDLVLRPFGSDPDNCQECANLFYEPKAGRK